jgi:AraC family transcriptional regulator
LRRQPNKTEYLLKFQSLAGHVVHPFAFGVTVATGRISIYDRAAQRSVPLVPSVEPSLDSTNAPWTGIKLEHYCIGATDRPEATTSSYLCAVGLNGSYQTKYAPGFGQRGFNVLYTPGAIFLTGPGELPARTSTGDFEFLALELAPKFVLWAANELVASGPFEVQQLWAAKDEQLRYIVLTLYNELLAGCPSGRLFGEYMGLSFATALLSNHSASSTRLAPYRGGLPPYKLRQVTEFISDNLSSNLSLAEMANLLQMGPCHFARAFKESMGLSPHQYVLRRRVERALQMLKETSGNLADIAYDLGFSSQGHFTTVFSKIVGVSPSIYRDQVHPLKAQLCYGTSDAAE